MNKQTMRIFACILCLVFTGFYYLIFNRQFNEDGVLSEQTQQIEQNSEEAFAEKEIYWLQLGIFNSKDTADTLISLCANIGIECHTYTRSDTITALCSPSDNRTDLIAIKELLDKNNIEYYEKSALISDQLQLKALSADSEEAYLEVISSLP